MLYITLLFSYLETFSLILYANVHIRFFPFNLCFTPNTQETVIELIIDLNFFLILD